jgi:hypothetical protein
MTDVVTVFQSAPRTFVRGDLQWVLGISILIVFQSAPRNSQG